jgi:uncharacterized coiled-coil protein SlyX
MLASLMVFLFPSSATAGGWWSFIHTDRSTVAVGQRVEAEAEVLFASIPTAREALDRRFYVYALRGFDYSIVRRVMDEPSPRGWWSLGDAHAVVLGPVALRISEANFGRARASFTVPELPSGTYALMFCDARCARPLADVVPTRGFTVVADPATAELAKRATRLEERLGNQAQALAAARAVTRSARAAVVNAESELRALGSELRTLDRAVAEAPSSPSPPFWAFGGWVVAGALAGAFAFLLLRRRSAKPPPPAWGGWQPSDDELRALVTSQGARRGRAPARRSTR